MTLPSAPFPITAPIEGSPADCAGWPNAYIGDSHVLVLDRHSCMLYETFNTHRCSGAWSASSETIWDLKNYDRRPWGWTSADAAGLPIFPGLVRYDEVAAGAINHAIRFTMQQTKNDANGGYFVAPASHAAGTTYGVSNIMGMRIRLKASFDISGYSAANKVILTAMKKYGMILADNGSYFYFQGVPDPRWNDDDLHNLDSIQSSNFEVVQMTPAFPGYDANTAPTGEPPDHQQLHVLRLLSCGWNADHPHLEHNQRLLRFHRRARRSERRNRNHHPNQNHNLHPERHQPIRPNHHASHRHRSLSKSTIRSGCRLDCFIPNTFGWLNCGDAVHRVSSRVGGHSTALRQDIFEPRANPTTFALTFARRRKSAIYPRPDSPERCRARRMPTGSIFLPGFRLFPSVFDISGSDQYLRPAKPG